MHSPLNLLFDWISLLSLRGIQCFLNKQLVLQRTGCLSLLRLATCLLVFCFSSLPFSCQSPLWELGDLWFSVAYHLVYHSGGGILAVLMNDRYAPCDLGFYSPFLLFPIDCIQELFRYAENMNTVESPRL